MLIQSGNLELAMSCIQGLPLLEFAKASVIA
jgi:hypothetical protein